MKNFYHPLMYNNFKKNDFLEVIKLLKSDNPKLTQGKNVKKFEQKWSKWLGVKYSIFVNSGSSANLITLTALKNLKKISKKNEIILPSLTWSSDVSSVIFNNFKPIFVDVNLENLSMDLNHVRKKINKKTLAVFITHAQGFNGLNQKFVNYLRKKNIILIEDVCESHGAKMEKYKLGSIGFASNFSFYYAHHMSTIEGGMICTNNKDFYQNCRVLRSHGMAREIGDIRLEKKIIKKHTDLSPKFIFLNPGFNMRNNEIGALIGISQLKKLDSNNKIRTKNFKYFLKNLNGEKYFINYNIKGSSNYAFPVILKKRNTSNRDLFEKILIKKGIEFRRGNAGGGNQTKQPYVKKLLNINQKELTNVNIIHDYGYYIGNYPSLSKKQILQLTNVLNSIEFN